MTTLREIDFLSSPCVFEFTNVLTKCTLGLFEPVSVVACVFHLVFLKNTLLQVKNLFASVVEDVEEFIFEQFTSHRTSTGKLLHNQLVQMKQAFLMITSIDKKLIDYGWLRTPKVGNDEYWKRWI